MSEQKRIADARRKLLEQRLRGKKKADNNKSFSAIIPKRSSDTPPRASYGQQGLWYIHQMQPYNAAYNMVNQVRMSGNLNVPAFKKSIDIIVQRHDALRTTFRLHDGELIQHIEPEIPSVFSVQSVTEADCDTLIDELMHQSFDVDDGPLVDVTLLQLSDTDAVLLIVMHHIISDKWSMEVLLWQEIATCYRALVADKAIDLDPVELQFADFSSWQFDQMQTPAYQKQLEYWVDHLQDAPALLQLPYDRPRPPVQQFDGDVLYSTLPSDLSQKLQAFSRNANTTLFMTMLTAFQVLLYRYSGQTDILVATSIDTRRDSRLEKTVGYFLNTIVMRENFEKPITFTELLDQVKNQSLRNFSNQDVDFERIVRELKPVRDPSYNPIFQTMFLLWDTNVHVPELPDLTLEAVKEDPKIAKFDLTGYVQTQENGDILLALEYAKSLFDLETIERMEQHFVTLLQSIVDAPDTLVSQLNMLPNDERQQIEDFAVADSYDYPSGALVQDLITQHPADSIAIQEEYGTMSYGELNERANQVAHYLKTLGVEADMPVGLCVERSSDMLIGILGILKAGGAYVPIDPDYPEERVQYMLDDAGISILLTQDMLTSQFTNSEMTIITLDSNPRIDLQATTAPKIDTTPQNLAYIIYTSGSTGQPKGVRITHQNLVHSTTARFDFYPKQAERFLLLSSYAFDSSIVGIFWTLCAGGTLCLPPHQGERDVKQLARLIETYQITHLLGLPSLYQILLDFAEPAQLQSLTTVMVAGEACPITLVEQHYSLLPDCGLYNEYGPTEGTVWSTAWEIPPDAETIFIGKPIPNMQAYILDEHQNLLPFGIHGELYIGGAGIAQGYHNRAELTAERFVENPFGDDGRLYRTGDLARLTANGSLEFFGRADTQVKISGYRIELGEIESALMQEVSVQEAVVLPVTETIVTPDVALDFDTLARYLQKQQSDTLLSDIEDLEDHEVSAILSALLGDKQL